MQRRSSGSSDEDSSSASAYTPPSLDDSSTNDDRSFAHRFGRDHPAPRPQSRSSSARPLSARSRKPSSYANWKPVQTRNGPLVGLSSDQDATVLAKLTDNVEPKGRTDADQMATACQPRWRNPWKVSLWAFLVAASGIALLYTILNSSINLHCDVKGCRMSYMRPSFRHFDDFDTEHTRFASKYSLYLYRENGVHDPNKISGIPVLFIPGNAGSCKQVRSIASESANYFHDALQHDPALAKAGVRNLDFFTVDFNEDFTAFHGQTMLDQAEYVNEAIRYILSLYLDPRLARRDPDLPDPTSVIILGHSMGGIVARTMLIMPNYQASSVNTIVTMSTPHAKAPVTFDPQIVRAYQAINDHWRNAYSQKWANNNPLWHVTLVSIAGGGLDTVVPSDYASLESIVPETHGFTVFTTSIPTVWTSMDHQAIMWCDQFRKVITRTLYEVVDNHRASQTKPRAERMRVFKKWLLPGLEEGAEKISLEKGHGTLLTLDRKSEAFLPLGARLTLRGLGGTDQHTAHLLSVPPSSAIKEKRLSLLSNSKLDGPEDLGRLEVLLCSVFTAPPNQPGPVFPVDIDLSTNGEDATRLACTNVGHDTILLPASTKTTEYPFFRDNEPQVAPFSYLQYNTEEISKFDYVAVIEKVGPRASASWVVAEFSDEAEARLTQQVSLTRLLAFGLDLQLPANRPLVTEWKIPSIYSSLLAYNLEVEEPACVKRDELFSPLVRQYLSRPYESKYFVNARKVEVSLHGVSPYVHPPLEPRNSDDGVSFQFWTDPSCDANISIRLNVDFMASLGKLYMRYRTIFAAFPMLIVALVLRKQFNVYDTTGVFMPFSAALDSCVKLSIPLVIFSLTMLSLATSQTHPTVVNTLWSWIHHRSKGDFLQNDLLIGSPDPFFWFILPMIGLVCIGVCMVLHYAALALTHVLSFIYGTFTAAPPAPYDDKKRAASPIFPLYSARRRIITTAVLLFLVSTSIPYQFAFVVACLVQLYTSARALRAVYNGPSLSSTNFSNYAHSIFLLMFWLLPINLPTLVVWVRNLTIRWFTPFSCHHNVLSILPFILLVETLSSGNMIPRVFGRFRHVTSFVLFAVAILTAIYGVSYGYIIHYLLDMVVAWLVAVHSTGESWSLTGLSNLFENENGDNAKRGKTP